MARKRTGRISEQRHNVLRSVTTELIAEEKKNIYTIDRWFVCYSYCINKTMLVRSFIRFFLLLHTSRRRVKRFRSSNVRRRTRERERENERGRILYKETKEKNKRKIVQRVMACANSCRKRVAPYFDVSPRRFSSVNIFHLHPLWSSMLFNEKEV